VEIFLAPNINSIKGGILIGFVTNLGRGLGRVLVGRNLSKSSKLPTTTIKVVAP